MKKFKPILKVFPSLILLSLILVTSLVFVTLDVVKGDEEEKYEQAPIDGLSHDFIPLPQIRSDIETVKQDKIEEVKKKTLAEQKERAEAILARYNSPFQGLGFIIVDAASRCGGDYKTLLAIAGNESGFGRIPYKLYNPFGYLNGVTYSGWEEALDFLSCRISQQYIAPCNNDLYCIVKNYAGPTDDKERWVYNINWFRNQI